MPQFIIFLIIGAAGVIVGSYFAMRRKGAQGAVGRRQTEMDGNIYRLKDYLSDKETVTNDEIERFLGVSDATVTKYMGRLEDEGFVEQVGREDRQVYYKIK